MDNLTKNNVGPCLGMGEEETPCPPLVVDPVEDPSPALSSTRSDAGGLYTPGFLDLPAEIRLQIYHWLHLMCPVRHAQLAPWYPTPVHCQYTVREVVDSAECATDEATSPITDKPTAAEPATDEPASEEPGQSTPKQAPASPSPSPGMLSPFRPLSGLPTGFLQCNSQIYHESRAMPFTNNEFVFVNWFASGLWAARAFTRALESWQRREMRFVRLEILARDLVGNGGSDSGAGQEEWLSLCDDWAAAVRGLRMKLVLGGSATGVMATGVAPGSEKDGAGFAEMQAAARRKVAAGLRRMGKLERLEMELVTRQLNDGDKLRWCEQLEEELRTTAGLEATRVVCTEKIQEKMKWIKQGVGMKHLQGLGER